jgi:hypothetical protein
MFLTTVPGVVRSCTIFVHMKYISALHDGCYSSISAIPTIAQCNPKLLTIDRDNVPESTVRAVPQIHLCWALQLHTIAIFAWQRAA